MNAQDEKCFLGYHLWEYVRSAFGGMRRRCSHCGKIDFGN